MESTTNTLSTYRSVDLHNGGSQELGLTRVAPHRVVLQPGLTKGGEVGCVDGLQFLMVGVGHGADAYHAGEPSGEEVAAQAGGGVHGTNDLHALHADKLKVAVVEPVVGDELGTVANIA